MGINSFLEHKFPKFNERIVEFKYIRNYKKNVKMVKQKGPEALINKLYTTAFGKAPNLESPTTFNEKLQWLKLNWYDSRIPICSNKKMVREYIEDKGFGSLLIPSYGFFENAMDIDFDKLPNSFVLKPSHDSGHIIVCRDKSTFNSEVAIEKLNSWMKVDYEYMSGEWPYQSKKYIVCEKFMEDRVHGELYDYKFFCFNGKPTYVFFCSDHVHHAKSDFYDMNWVKQDFRWIYEPSNKTFDCPIHFEEMKSVAKALSEGFLFVRVDFYEINGELYFGELTFYHGGGLGWFKPAEMDKIMGDMIELPQKSDPSPWEIVHPEIFK